MPPPVMLCAGPARNRGAAGLGGGTKKGERGLGGSRGGSPHPTAAEQLRAEGPDGLGGGAPDSRLLCAWSIVRVPSPNRQETPKFLVLAFPPHQGWAGRSRGCLAPRDPSWRRCPRPSRSLCCSRGTPQTQKHRRVRDQRGRAGHRQPSCPPCWSSRSSGLARAPGRCCFGGFFGTFGAALPVGIDPVAQAREPRLHGHRGQAARLVRHRLPVASAGLVTHGAVLLLPVCFRISRLISGKTASP